MFKDKELLLLRLFVFFIPYNIGVGWIVGYRAIFASDIFLFSLLFYWISKKPSFKVESSMTPATLMVVWGCVSLLVAISQILGVIAVLLIVRAYLFYFYIINRITTRKRLREIVDILLISMSVQGAIGLAQKLNGGPIGLYRFGEYMGAMKSEISRVSGTMLEPNSYASYLILLLPLAYILFMFLKVKPYKYYYGGAALLAISGLFLSLSRSSWAGFIISIFFMILVLVKRGKISPKLFKAVAAILIIIIVIGAVFWDVIEQRFDRGADGKHRHTMMDISYQILADNYLFGVGLFNYEFHSFHHFAFWKPVHNTYMRLACETGIPGLLFFLWFVIYHLRTAYQGTRIKDQYLSMIALGAFGGMIAFLVTFNFGPMYHHYRLKLIFWILCALVVAIKRIRKNEAKEYYKEKLIKYKQNKLS